MTGLARWFFLLLLVLGCSAWSSGEAAPEGPALTAEEQRWLAENDGKIRVGITEVPPLMVRDLQSGDYRGLAIDYLHLHEQRLGVRFKVVYFANWAQALEAARNKNIDVLLPTVRTPEREQFLLFPPPYATLENKIIVRRGEFAGRQLTLDDLAGKRVSVMLDSAAHEKLRREFPAIQPVPVADEKQVLTEVAFHNADAAVVELGRATWYIEREKLTNLAVGGHAGISYAIAMAVRNDRPLLAGILEKTVRTITPQEHEAINDRWIRLEDGTVAAWVWWSIAAGGTVAVVALLLFGVWTRSLKRLVKVRTDELAVQLEELKATQRQLTDEEMRFRALAELASDWFWEQDAELRYTRFFGGGLEKAPLDFSEFVGRHRWELPVIGITDRMWEEHRATVERHQPFRGFTYQIVRRDGHRMWLVTNGEPVFDAAGQFAGYRGTARDITAQMHAQDELADSYQRIRALLDGTYSFVGLLSADGVLLEANCASLDFIGATRTQVIGRPFWETPWWSGMQDRERLRAALSEARAGRFVRYEAIHPDRDGAVHWIDFSVNPIRDQFGNVVYLVPEGRDITEAKRAAEALDLLLTRTSGLFGERFLRTLVEQLANVLGVRHVFVGELLPGGARVRTLALWADGRIADNMEYALSDTPCDRVIGYDTCVFPRDVASLFPRDVLLAEMGIESYIGTPIFGSDNQPIGILVAMHDQPLVDTDSTHRLMEIFSARAGLEMVREQHEQAVRRLNENLELRVAERTAQLAAANKELEAFSYSVSHDLRAPLRHIGGFVQLLGEEAGPGLSAEGRRYLQIISESATRMGTLIDDLLAFSRVGRAELHRSALHLDKLLEEVIQDLAGQVTGRDVEWKIDPLPQVLADRAMLRQVFLNLLDNALKYSRPRAQAVIEVGCLPGHKDGKRVFFVRDNGVGFNMKYIDKLFGVFQRLHGSSEFEGTGIGLANVRRIVEKHGGAVWAEGMPDAGAVFYFSLPDGPEMGVLLPGGSKEVANE